MMRRRWPAVLVLAVVLSITSVPAMAEAPDYYPGLAEMSAMMLLGSAADALDQLKAEENPLQRDILYTIALTALIGLYQLHGCNWAREPLVELYKCPDCPDMHVGYSSDGRLSLRIAPLELKNPVFYDYTVFLCTLESNTSLDLTAEQDSMLAAHLCDGRVLYADELTLEHPLYADLFRLEHTFEPVACVPSGTGKSFKQLYSVPRLSAEGISAVSLVWGEYMITVPYFENEVEID